MIEEKDNQQEKIAIHSKVSLSIYKLLQLEANEEKRSLSQQIDYILSKHYEKNNKQPS